MEDKIILATFKPGNDPDPSSAEFLPPSRTGVINFAEGASILTITQVL